MYEGSPSGIVEQLWDGSFDREIFPNLERYISHIAQSFVRLTDIPCDLPHGSTDERAHALLLRLSEIDALEVLEDA